MAESGLSRSERRTEDRKLRRSASVTYGEGTITVYRAIPCPDPCCNCNYGSERVFQMEPGAARELARELERCARYAEERQRRGEATNREAQAPLPASVSATPEGSQGSTGSVG